MSVWHLLLSVVSLKQDHSREMKEKRRKAHHTSMSIDLYECSTRKCSMMWQVKNFWLCIDQGCTYHRSYFHEQDTSWEVNSMGTMMWQRKRGFNGGEIVVSSQYAQVLLVWIGRANTCVIILHMICRNNIKQIFSVEVEHKEWGMFCNEVSLPRKSTILWENAVTRQRSSPC